MLDDIDKIYLTPKGVVLAKIRTEFRLRQSMHLLAEVFNSFLSRGLCPLGRRLQILHLLHDSSIKTNISVFIPKNKVLL